MNLTDTTIVHNHKRHLVCNGSTAVGWLTACSVRTPVGMPALWTRIADIDCESCQTEMEANDY